MNELDTRLAGIESRLKALEDLDDRVDGHDAELAAIRTELRHLQREVSLTRLDVGRVANSQTGHGLILERVHTLLEQFVRQQTPKVEV